MSQFLIRLYNAIYRLIYPLVERYYLQKWSRGELELHVFDIDNTIADTWPSFHKSYRSERERLESLPIFENMKKHVQSQEKKSKVVFLSARNIQHLALTIRWLKKNDLAASLSNTLLVQHPSDKVHLLKKLIHLGANIVFYDDLSYNTERGETKFYEAEIALLKNMPLKFIDYHSLLDLQHQKNGDDKTTTLIYQT